MRNRPGSQRLVLLLLARIALLVAILTGGAALAQDTEEIRYGLEGAERAEVELHLGVGTLRLGALEEGDALVVGTAETAGDEEIQREFTVADEVAELRLESQETFSLFGNLGDDRVWDLRLNPSLPVALTVEVSAGRAELDLRRLNLNGLLVTTGVGESVITLPEEGQFEANISGGVGALTVRIPANLAARISSSTGLGSLNVLGDFRQEGDLYVSPDYENAENRVDLQLETGVGEVTIETVE